MASQRTVLATDGDRELYLLNHCLSSAEKVHFFVSSSFIDATGAVRDASALLDADNQAYLSALWEKYSKSAADRKHLRSGTSLYYLECLVNPDVREDFIKLAASALFPGLRP